MLKIFLIWIRDRPFNLKRWGGYGFLFRSEKFFLDNTRVRIYFFLSREAQFFFQNLTLGYRTKTLNQIIFFPSTKNQNIFFSNIGNQNIFLVKNHNPPFKLNGRSLSVSIRQKFHLKRNLKRLPIIIIFRKLKTNFQN
jgi:hypothetical protein